MDTRRRQLLFVAAAAVALVVGAVTAQRVLRSPPPAPWTATVYSAPRALPGFSLVDHVGAPFTRARFAGGWSLVFFGFTHCPDICPTTLLTLRQASTALADLGPGERPTIVLVTVDPARDTPAVLAEYVAAFGDDVVGVTGELAEIEALAAHIGVAFGYTPARDDGGYSVDHTASIFVVSPGGAVSAVFTPPHDAAAIAADYRRLVGAATPSR